jgi:hypothetical protein
MFGLKLSGVGDRSEARGQHGESGDGHVVTVVSDLGATSALCRGDDLGPGLAIWVWDWTLWVSVVRLVLGTSHVLDVVAVALLALHDAMDNTGRVVLAVVLRSMPRILLFALTVALVDVAAGVMCTPVLVEVGAEVVVPHAVHLRVVGLFWSTFPWMVGSLLCTGRLDRLLDCRLDEDAIYLDATLFSSTRAVATEGRP